MFSNRTTSTVKATSSIEEQGKYTVIPLYFRHTGTGNWYGKDTDFPVPSFLPDLIPDELQIEYEAAKNIQSDFILRSRRCHGTQRVSTGLQPTSFDGWYYGDAPTFQDGQITKSLILVQFSPDSSMFRLYLFHGYYPSGKTVSKSVISKILHIIRSRQAGRKNKLNSP